jgi:hypothetical protein
VGVGVDEGEDWEGSGTVRTACAVRSSSASASSHALCSASRAERDGLGEVNEQLNGLGIVRVTINP